MGLPILPRYLARNGWTTGQLLLGALAMAVSVVVTSDAWSDIYHMASIDEEYSHIFLVPFVAGWLVWIRRMRIRRCPMQGLWLGPVLLVMGWFLYSYGDLNQYQVFWHFGAMLVLLGCFFSVAGTGVLMRFLPAFLVLAFMIPVPGRIRQEIAMPLQSASAEITQRVLEVLNVEVERTGNVLTINDQQVAIAEACNGLRMVFALFLVSAAFAFGTPLRPFVRFIVIAASPVSALICNVVRLVPTVWLYGRDPEFAETFHDISGWLMLPLAFLVLMGIIRALRWALLPVYRYTLAYGT